MPTPRPTDRDIEEQLDAAIEQQAEGTKWPGMKYEDGVMNALRWALGEDDTKPMEDE